jgi:hypothetical protein
MRRREMWYTTFGGDPQNMVCECPNDIFGLSADEIWKKNVQFRSTGITLASFSGLREVGSFQRYAADHYGHRTTYTITTPIYEIA